jgi:hypothetical protein
MKEARGCYIIYREKKYAKIFGLESYSLTRKIKDSCRYGGRSCQDHTMVIDIKLFQCLQDRGGEIW